MLAADVKDQVSGEIVLKQGEFFRQKKLLKKLSKVVTSSVLVRSVLTCHIKRGICAHCYGYDLSRGELVDIGVTVGTIAAQSIGEPGTQLTLKNFSILVEPQVVLQLDHIFLRNMQETVKWREVQTVESKKGKLISVSRKSTLVVVAKDGRELQEHDIEYGSVLYVKK